MASPGGTPTPAPRVVIESVRPEVDCGAFPVKRVVGEEVRVEADVFADGHDVVVCELLHRYESEEEWTAVPMTALGNDRWAASFVVGTLGRHHYTVRGWTDPFLTWQRDLVKRREAGQDLATDLLIGAALATDDVRRVLADASRTQDARFAAAVAAAAPPPSPERTAAYERTLTVEVEPVRARFSSWYEMFPRSARGDGTHATFDDVIARLPYVAALGFDVLYLPPIHPIGRTGRKGKNNTMTAGPEDVGSPWAIGAAEGGHTAIHPDLGSFDDFARLVHAAEGLGIQIALDVAFQASPDHPYVAEHPDWFRRRPDGTVQYAENPPKKYQDIYPFDFECADWQALYAELTRVFAFWVERGVKIFRVDNPHTKPFAFWAWALRELKRAHRDVIFLSEAFTRPRVMHRLAKVGFSQSYTYFTWRVGKQELEDYFTELTGHASREYFRPNVWPNTPDILHEYLQTGGRPAFIARVVLAATLAANYGLYGPAYELGAATPVAPGSEEYDRSEKYEIKRWDLDAAGSLAPIIGALNRIRRENPALQRDWNLRFHAVSNDQLLVYSKVHGDNRILVAVNLDPRNVQSGFVDLSLADLGLGADEEYVVDDLLGGGRYVWKGAHNYVELRPHDMPAHVFRVHGRSAEGARGDDRA